SGQDHSAGTSIGAVDNEGHILASSENNGQIEYDSDGNPVYNPNYNGGGSSPYTYAIQDLTRSYVYVNGNPLGEIGYDHRKHDDVNRYQQSIVLDLPNNIKGRPDYAPV